MPSSIVVAASLVLGFSALGQEAGLRFEAASIKPADPQRLPVARLNGGPGSPDPERIAYTNVPLLSLLVAAYGVQDYQVSGPAWLKSERYDIIATLPPRATQGQFQTMLKDLLLDRFNVSLHHEARSMSVYKLTVAENGLRLQEAETAKEAGAALAGQSGPPSDRRMARDKDGFLQIPPGRQAMVFVMGDGLIRYTARMQSISNITGFLTHEIGRPVVNKTGLAGNFDFTLAFDRPVTNPANPGQVPAPVAAPTGGPSLQKAVHDQLGLTLTSATEPVDILVIDRVEKVPTPN
jgi:uncharacterized protein (TIGR03435 family)